MRSGDPGGSLTGWALREELARRGSAEVRLQGMSMWPVLLPGMRLRLRPLREGEPVRGQVIAFERGQRPVLHRVLAVRGEVVITRGDGCWRADPPVGRGQVLGVAESLVTPAAVRDRLVRGPRLAALLRPAAVLRVGLSWCRGRLAPGARG